MLNHALKARLAVAIGAICSLAPAASAAGAFYLGAWKITSAKIAPWWDDSSHPPSSSEMKSLVGKTITITPKSIEGPRALACTGVHYVLKDYPADMLFQGAFDEMRRRDKSIDPAKLAGSLGFRGASWKTLETGCAVEIDYHFIDSSTAAFGLNDYVYILTRQ
jgi:hypothetical protein